MVVCSRGLDWSVLELQTMLFDEHKGALRLCEAL